MNSILKSLEVVKGILLPAAIASTLLLWSSLVGLGPRGSGVCVAHVS